MSNKTTTTYGNKEIFIRNVKRYSESSGKKQIDVAKAVGVTTG